MGGLLEGPKGMLPLSQISGGYPQAPFPTPMGLYEDGINFQKTLFPMTLTKFTARKFFKC